MRKGLLHHYQLLIITNLYWCNCTKHLQNPSCLPSFKSNKAGSKYDRSNSSSQKPESASLWKLLRSRTRSLIRAARNIITGLSVVVIRLVAIRLVTIPIARPVIIPTELTVMTTIRPANDTLGMIEIPLYIAQVVLIFPAKSRIGKVEIPIEGTTRITDFLGFKRIQRNLKIICRIPGGLGRQQTCRQEEKDKPSHTNTN